LARPRKHAPVVKNYAPDIQDKFIKRIAECQEVLDHLDKCPAWNVITRDLENFKKYIDDNWQNIPESDNRLKELRVTKMAYMHLLNLKDSYKVDLENAQKELYKIQNPEKVINKDYDNA